MKKTIILLVFISLTIILKGQEYIPLIENNKSWNVLSVEYIPGDPYYDTTYSTICYELMGDTLINSLSYFKLYKSEEEFPENWIIDAFLREDDQQKIWMLKDINEGEYLLYDFDIEQGDVIEVGYFDPVSLTVDSITVVEIEGTDRLKYWLSYGDDYRESWVTGIGSNKGIVYSGSTFITGGWYWLLCASDQDGVYYSNPDFESCYLITSIQSLKYLSLNTYPNAAQNNITFELPQITKESFLYIKDMYGKTIIQIPLAKAQSKTQWDCSGISPGVYFYQTQINGEVYRGKIVVN